MLGASCAVRPWSPEPALVPLLPLSWPQDAHAPGSPVGILTLPSLSCLPYFLFSLLLTFNLWFVWAQQVC